MAGRPVGLPKTGGRQAGTPNKNTADIKALAQKYGPAAIARLAEMAGLVTDDNGRQVGVAKNEAVQQGAIKELIDRGYGKARQPVSGPDADDDAAQPLQIVYRWAAKDE